jgi:hypothetical protein
MKPLLDAREGEGEDVVETQPTRIGVKGRE